MGRARHSARELTFGVEPKLRQTIIETEWLLIEDELTSPLPADGIQLEYYEDAYPKLPACLDRRPVHELAQAA